MPFEGLQAENSAFEPVYIGLGANQTYRGRQPLENLNLSLGFLAENGVEFTRYSRPWRTPAWPDPNDPPFVNAVACAHNGRSPDALLALLHETEARFGRVRHRRNAPRSLDLDLIDWRGAVRAPAHEDGLALPHPRLQDRAFVLLPLRDVAPHWRHPVTGASLDQLIGALPRDARQSCRPAGGVLCAAA